MTLAHPKNYSASRSSVALTMAASLGLLFSAGCSAEPKSAPVAETSKVATGVVETAKGPYRFTPGTCAIYNDGGTYDIEIGGVGEAPDGEGFYFELSSTGNYVDIKLGADGPFVSTDRRLKAGQYVSEAFDLDVSDGTISVPVLVLVDENGQMVDPTASLTIDCD